MTITGTNFSATAANNEAAFNGTLATVTVATTTNLTTTVPAGATTGKIAVTVGAQIVESADDFTVTTPPPLPTIASFAPTSCAVGDMVTITGTNFSATAANNEAAFNGTLATVTMATTTSLTTTVPAGAMTGKIIIVVSGQRVESVNNFTVAPTITGFDPTDGAVGDAVTIMGTNFGATVADNTVAFNRTTATVTMATTTSLTMTVPAGATTGKIAVTVGAQSVESADDFTIR